MSTFTFAVLSDTHIRLENGSRHTVYPSDRLANGRNRYVVKEIVQLAPDLVIHLGDVVHPIPALPVHENAVQIARDMYQCLDGKLYVVPGNHDIGDKAKAWVPAPELDGQSYRVFESYWNSTYLSFDHQGCHFVLINSSVLNSGLVQEKEQQAWLEQDLAANHKVGKRVFLFTHYPFYLDHPHEGEHYDNIAEPARSWLLSVLEAYDVKAVFAGHSHNFFYDRYRNTDLYVVPSVTFVRPDFSELFHTDPALEFGRNDATKLGFFLVRVDQEGYRVESIRTHGLTDEQAQDIVTRPFSLSAAPPQPRAAPVGIFLRHTWAQSIEMPYGNLDEFTRKPVRNDYLVQALWELGIRKLRVPIGDLANDRTRRRMRVLLAAGHEFTVFSVGVPTRQTRDTIGLYPELIAAWEIVTSSEQIPEVIRGIRDVKKNVAVQAYLSKIDTFPHQHGDQESYFSHFPSHGFRLDERDLLSECITHHDTVGVIDGFVFCVTPDTLPWQGIQLARQIASDLGLAAMVHVLAPREDEGIVYAVDHEISNLVAETLVTALTAPEVQVFLDTFVDHDRGYYPRNGLLDRRYNPRSSYYVFRHLVAALGSDLHTLRVTQIAASAGVRAFALQTSYYFCALLLSDEGVEPGEISLSWLPAINVRDGVGKWLDLRTGKVQKVHWEQLLPDGGRIAFERPSGYAGPALFILNGSHLNLAQPRV